VLKKILVAAALLVAIAALVIGHEIGYANIVGMLRYDQRREGRLHVGDKAPDVVLGKLDGTSEVRLLDALHAKPLILIFGSYT
jgi:hypothetical protein